MDEHTTLTPLPRATSGNGSVHDSAALPIEQQIRARDADIAHLHGQLEMVSRLERSAQRAADRVEADASVLREQVRSLARELGQAEGRRAQLESELERVRADNLERELRATKYSERGAWLRSAIEWICKLVLPLGLLATIAGAWHFAGRSDGAVKDQPTQIVVVDFSALSTSSDPTQAKTTKPRVGRSLPTESIQDLGGVLRDLVAERAELSDTPQPLPDEIESPSFLTSLNGLYGKASHLRYGVSARFDDSVPTDTGFHLMSVPRLVPGVIDHSTSRIVGRIVLGLSSLLFLAWTVLAVRAWRRRTTARA
jgi:hypothetical protein